MCKYREIIPNSICRGCHHPLIFDGLDGMRPGQCYFCDCIICSQCYLDSYSWLILVGERDGMQVYKRHPSLPVYHYPQPTGEIVCCVWCIHVLKRAKVIIVE
jgi:hypothetical protein